MMEHMNASRDGITYRCIEGDIDLLIDVDKDLVLAILRVGARQRNGLVHRRARSRLLIGR
jgi:hypothetical protein